MKLNRVYARFYKSFNIDHVRKATPGAKPHGEWEMFEGGWHPYVEVPVDSRITAVVGANESGKSQLIGAIERGITGTGFDALDLCRYCQFFGVEAGRKVWPHIGLSWTGLTIEESDRLQTLLGTAGEQVQEFLMFREDPTQVVFWIRHEGEWRSHTIAADMVHGLVGDLLPMPVVVDANTALPDTASLAWLASGDLSEVGSSRQERHALFTSAAALRAIVTDDPQSISAHAGQVHALLRPLAKATRDAGGSELALRLVRELLFDLARIDPGAFADLRDAIGGEKEGLANGLTDKMNEQLAGRLNFPKWWVQDRDFTLRVSAREHDLVFTIRDRTGREYTFGERSSGLKYFLSYLIQCQALRRGDGRPRILLMDEPDAHLSAEAQQDLLRIFEDLVVDDGDAAAVQIVYVTHSPFLLDKNHAERLVVVEKGSGLDGTRVIRNAAQHHYEPLRSAFGAFLGESAFVGSVNLLVEGQADQILLAGAARALRRRRPGVENDTLDLNRLVIVPCNGASQMPYMVYLIRGRDADKPPVIALLDSDKDGRDAATLMQEDDKFRSLIGKRFILSVGDLVKSVEAEELEDFIPPELAVAAANLLMREAQAFRAGDAPVLTVEKLVATRKVRLYDQVEAATAKVGRSVGKAAFARAVGEIANSPGSAETVGLGVWLERMALVFRVINAAKLQAQAVAIKVRQGARVSSRVEIFITDQPNRARREQVSNLLIEIDGQLDQTNEGDLIRSALLDLHRRHGLDEDPGLDVADYPALVTDLRALRYAYDARKALKEAPPREGRTERRPRGSAGPGPKRNPQPERHRREP